MRQTTKRPPAALREPQGETRQKKTARRLAPSSSRVQGLRREHTQILLYQIPGRMQASIWTGRRCFPSMTWGFLLELIGAGWLTKALFRVIDWIER